MRRCRISPLNGENISSQKCIPNFSPSSVRAGAGRGFPHSVFTMAWVIFIYIYILKKLLLGVGLSQLCVKRQLQLLRCWLLGQIVGIIIIISQEMLLALRAAWCKFCICLTVIWADQKYQVSVVERAPKKSLQASHVSQTDKYWKKMWHWDLMATECKQFFPAIYCGRNAEGSAPAGNTAEIGWEIGFSFQFCDGRVQMQTWRAAHPVLL